eukprot:1486967-Amphidinium_carterae.1
MHALADAARGIAAMLFCYPRANALPLPGKATCHHVFRANVLGLSGWTEGVKQHSIFVWTE